MNFTKDSFKTMRARELRNFLIQKADFDRDFIAKIIDREELRKLAEENYVEGMVFVQEVPTKSFPFVQVAILAIFVAVLYHFGYLHLMIDDQWRLRLKALRKSIKRKNYLAVFFFALTNVVMCYLVLLKLRVLLSWVSWLIPDVLVLNYLPCLHLPVSTDSITKLLAKKSNFFEDQGSFTVDMGPMVFMWILEYVKRYLEETGSRIMLNEGENTADINKLRKKAD